MREWVELLMSKTVVGAMAGVVIALNRRFAWVEVSDDDLIVLVGLVLAFVVAALRRSQQKTEKAAIVAGQKAEAAVEEAADLAAEKAVRACQ